MLSRPIAAAILCFLLAGVAHAEGRDGRLFDHGATMAAPSEHAPEPTTEALFLLGTWDVDCIHYENGEQTHRSRAVARTTLLNRGHGFLERFRCPDLDGQGHVRHTVSFITFAPSTQLWNVGVADSWTECITLHTGQLENGAIVAETVRRPDGSGPLMRTRLTLAPGDGDDGGFDLLEEEGPLDGKLELRNRRIYRPASRETPQGQGHGRPAADLPEEAHQFDFLIGEWEESHDLTFPDGRRAQWKANGTCVWTLGGHAILEHGWYDVDPQNPDAATSIVRIYNRAMRRWESMYSSNRGNSILHFGGVKEGDRIVLHKFQADTARPPINYWVFHDMQPDSYGWYGHTSTDRGQTFRKTWIIEGRRKAGPAGRP